MTLSFEKFLKSLIPTQFLYYVCIMFMHIYVFSLSRNYLQDMNQTKYLQQLAIKAMGGGSWSKRHVKLILKNSFLWFQRFLRNVKIQLSSVDMDQCNFRGLDFYLRYRGVIFDDFWLFLPIKCFYYWCWKHQNFHKDADHG